jgi:hypothetical protein
MRRNPSRRAKTVFNTKLSAHVWSDEDEDESDSEYVPRQPDSGSSSDSDFEEEEEGKNADEGDDDGTVARMDKLTDRMMRLDVCNQSK